ncbi:MAG TPA: hypothetical protein VGM23_03050 [Armatimonadota bacterium]
MTLLSTFAEKFQVGVIFDPFTRRREIVNEMVTVCPACRSFHSLRQEGDTVYCTECGWRFRPAVPTALE